MIYLVTGASGAFGAWAAKRLLDEGHRVVSIKHDEHPYDTASLLGISDKITWARGSITDENFCKRVVADYAPNSIWHFAALPLVQTATRTSRAIFETNTMGTVNLLEAVKESSWVGKPIRFVFCASDKAYGSAGNVKYVEEMPLNAAAVYDASKAAADLIARTYANCRYAPALVVVRPCNILAPGDMNFGRLLNRIIIPCCRGERPNLYRSDNLLREYIWVEDAVDAIWTLDEAQRLISSMNGEAYNISAGQARTLDEVVKQVMKHFPGLEPIWVPAPEISENVEIPYQELSTKKIEACVGWKAKTNFETSVARLVAWYKNNWAWLPESLKTIKVEGWH